MLGQKKKSKVAEESTSSEASDEPSSPDVQDPDFKVESPGVDEPQDKIHSMANIYTPY